MGLTKQARAAANADISTMPIKGRDYATVATRLNRFWEVCPGGAIKTIPVEITGAYAVIRAEIYDDKENLIASGIAKEAKSNDPKSVDYTKYVENAETSAVGRALANAGIGSEANIASADELVAALKEQKELLTGKQLLTVYCNERGLLAKDVSDVYELDKVPKGQLWPYYKAVAELMKDRGE